jgi:DUF1680 family protein
MLKKIVIALVLLTGCAQSPEVKIEENKTDSLLIKSRETIIKTDIVYKKSDSVVNKKINNVVNQINVLKQDNTYLKNAISLKTERIIRDTIYITEKKNFWGKTKKTIDSSQSVEIDTLENK